MEAIMLQNPELKIEKEFRDLLSHDEDCTPIEVPFLYRQNKRDRYNNPIYCKACNEARSGIKEGSLDCPYCLGSGTEWEQKIGKGWFSKFAFTTERTLTTSIPDKMSDSSFFKLYLYTNKELVLKDTDSVLIPTLTATGNILLPLRVEGIYSVFEDFNFRANQLQSEYNRYRLSTTFEATYGGLLK